MTSARFAEAKVKGRDERIVDDTRGLVLLRDFEERPQGQPVTQLHDIHLMHRSDPLTSVL